MFSVPPVRTTSASPSLISCAALMIVWKPDPQSLDPSSAQPRLRSLRWTDLLTVSAGTSTGSPARWPTWRAT